MLKRASDLKVGDFVKMNNSTFYEVANNHVGDVLFIIYEDVLFIIYEDGTSYKGLHLFYDDQEDIDFAKSQLGLELI